MKQYTIRVTDEVGKKLVEYERVNGGGTGKIAYAITMILNQFFLKNKEEIEEKGTNWAEVAQKAEEVDAEEEKKIKEEERLRLQEFMNEAKPSLFEDE